MPNALFCPVGPSPPDCCCIGCSCPDHTTGPLAADVDTFAVGALAAVPSTGLAVAQAARPISDAGRHTDLSFIEILTLNVAVESVGLSNTVSTGKFRCQWNGCRRETKPAHRRI